MIVLGDFISYDVSVIILIDNLDFVEDCLDSIVNQTLSNIEIICINCISYCSLDIVNNFANDDIRFKVMELDNFDLNNIDSEYVMFVNSTDWLNLFSLELIFNKAKTEDLDILIYDLLFYNCNNFYEKLPFYDVSSFKKKFIPNVFNHYDIYDILFSIPKCLFNKLFKTNFLKECNINFNEFSIFNDYILFFKSILKANKISFIDYPVYVKREYPADKKLPINILNGLVDCCNNIFEIFKENNCFKYYEHQLVEYKIDCIKFWYIFINNEFKNFSFEYIRNDFINMNLSDNLLNFYLTNASKEFYKLFLKSNNPIEFELISENFNFNRSIGNSDSKLAGNDVSEEYIHKIKDGFCMLNNINEELFFKVDLLSSQNNARIEELTNIINDNTILISNLNNKIEFLNKKISMMIKDIELNND